MDTIQINITDIPNEVTVNVTEIAQNVTVNISEGTSFACTDVESCQVIQDLQTETASLQNQIDNLPPPATPTLQSVINTDNTVNGTIAKSLSNLTTVGVTDQGAEMRYFDGLVTALTQPSFIQNVLSWANAVTSGFFKVNEFKSKMTHTVLNEFDAPVHSFNNSVTKDGYELATENFVDNRVQSNIKIIGDWDATSGSYPLADESNTTPFITQWGATIKAGWAFRVGYGQNGTVGGYEYENGDVVYALIDSPTNAASDWGDLDHNLQQATESLRGTAKIATELIVEDENNADNETIVTPYRAWNSLLPRFLSVVNTWVLKQTFTTAPRLSSTTASQRLEVDANKDVISVAKATADNKDFGVTAGTVLEGNRITQTLTAGVVDKVPSEDAVKTYVDNATPPAVKLFSYYNFS